MKGLRSQIWHYLATLQKEGGGKSKKRVCGGRERKRIIRKMFMKWHPVLPEGGGNLGQPRWP